MPCRNCIVSMELQVGHFSHYGPCDSCGNMQDNYTVTDSHNVLDLTDQEKTLLMGIDRNRVVFHPLNYDYLKMLRDNDLIIWGDIGDKVRLTPKGFDWLSYLVSWDNEAKSYWMKLRIKV